MFKAGFQQHVVASGHRTSVNMSHSPPRSWKLLLIIADASCRIDRGYYAWPRADRTCEWTCTKDVWDSTASKWRRELVSPAEQLHNGYLPGTVGYML